MAKSLRYTVKYRRHRKQRTNYRKRLELLKSGELRLVIRRGHNNIVAQIVKYEPQGDRILFSFTSQNLKKMGWKGHGGNIPTAYLVGYALGKKANKKVKKLIVDIGLHKVVKGSSLFACMKGVADAGIEISYNEEILPSEDRIMGKHISEDYPKMFEAMKNKIEGEFK